MHRNHMIYLLSSVMDAGQYISLHAVANFNK